MTITLTERAVEGGSSGLRSALGAEVEEREHGATAAVTETIETASEVTAKVEHAQALFKAVASGELDTKQALVELDALLGLLERLDRKGRYKEALKLARAASALAALLMRWSQLLQSLRIALRAAKALDDLPAVAWAQHELGTLQLAGGDMKEAEQNLTEAREARRRLGDRRGTATTERNLQTLCEQARQLIREEKLVPPPPRMPWWRRPALPFAVGAALLGLGGVAGAIVDNDGNGGGGLAAAHIAIRVPVEGARYRAGESVLAHYGCAADADGPRLSSCVGSVRPGRRIDTRVGRHTFTVTAMTEDGRKTVETASYTVSRRSPSDHAEPTIRIDSPPAGVIRAGRRLRADYGCEDEPGGSGLKSCRATSCEVEPGNTVVRSCRDIPNGALLDGALGQHTFTVDAADAAGNRSVQRLVYTVSSGPAEKVAACGDGNDNDGDALTDEADPGCTNRADPNEEPVNQVSECSDGKDNDRDGLIDAFDPKTQTGDPGCSDDGKEAPPNPPDPPPPSPDLR